MNTALQMLNECVEDCPKHYLLTKVSARKTIKVFLFWRQPKL